MPVDVNKLLELLIKYKTQVSYLVAFILCVGCFIGGRMSIDCPPKADVCKAELRTIDRQFAQLQAKDREWTEKLNTQRDTDERSCAERIQTEIENALLNSDIVQCEEVCTLYSQCERAGRCR